MNKKGFTTIEVVLSFTLVVVILVALTRIVINYRDNVTDEGIKTRMLDFKNTITKIVYDDIVSEKYTRIEYCINDNRCVNFFDHWNNYVTLKCFTNKIETAELDIGIYIQYDGINYKLPDSELNKYTNQEELQEYLVDIKDFVLSMDEENEIYAVNIPIYHRGVDKNYTINLVVS